MQKLWALVLIVAALPGLPGLGQAAAAAESYVAYSGTASAPQTKKFLYGESHVLKFQDGRLAQRVVLYTCPDGTAFARKTASYVNALAPDFSLEDVSTGLQEGVRSEGGLRTVYFRGTGAAAEKASTLPPVDGLVADTGFDEFVRKNWATLMSGRALDMPFLLPSRAEQRSFRIEHVRSERVDDTAVELFRLRLSGFLGLVVPSIDVYYGAADHALVRYVGLSDLRDAAHENFKADIDFPPSARLPAGQELLDRARRTRLAACH